MTYQIRKTKRHTYSFSQAYRLLEFTSKRMLLTTNWNWLERYLAIHELLLSNDITV